MDWNKIIDSLPEWKSVFASILGGIVTASGFIANRRTRRKKDFLFADQTLNDANVKIIELRRKNMNLEGENHILYKLAISVALDCGGCAQEKIDELPSKIKSTIKESLHDDS